MKKNVTIFNINYKFPFTLFLFCLLLSSYVYSRSSGVSGYTLKSGTAGCSCHGASVSSVSVTISGPSTLKAGETGSYTATITGGSGTGVGADIAASKGNLANTDGNLKLLNGELTHTSARSFSGGRYTFNFSYTAPASAGVQTLYATGVSSKQQWNFAPNFSVNVQSPVSGGIKDNGQPVDNYSLQQNYPNPFNPVTKISYSLPKQSSVKLIIYNSIGQEITTLVNGLQPAGNYSVNFDGSGLSSGIYFYSIEAKSENGNEVFKSIKKMALLK
ncbi:MAG: T9SS type A sorting domain-containing protein [Ignavibacteria bacterium]|jgi:hypothetical protein|nr:T9SS type A sorting domain-containing protein [Ignavibacteria bacterium]MCU7504942.1 T9SS type A sorting domain-containing protein [Ignavibacteria bacterium]MCU7518399.1 T9SS type A sorting domain-containing protein [Ignavibacteria bacterium]